MSRIPRSITPARLAATALLATCTLLFMACGSDSNGPVQTGTLAVSLDPSLDGGGTIKATTITQAVLLNTSGATVATATIQSGAAVFDLGGVVAGDYFIIINDSTLDAVPTRILDPSTAIHQPVGQKLRASRVIVGTDTLFRIKTFSEGQGEHPIVAYSSGANVVPPAYAYALLAYRTSPQQLDLLRMGDAATLMSTTAASSPHIFATWVLGSTNHGTGPAGDSTQTNTQCGGCHTNFNVKPPTWSSISPTNGFCWRCHAGLGGDPNGVLDPAS